MYSKNKTNCFLLLVSNPSRPSLHSISCMFKALNLVICQQPTIGVKVEQQYKGFIFDFKNTFKCTTGIYISILNLCNGKIDCPVNAADETNCTCLVDGKEKYDSHFCSNNCHPFNCSCSPLLRQKLLGGCEMYHKVIDVIPTKQLDSVSDFLENENDITLLYSKGYKCLKGNMIECYPGLQECYHESDQCQYLLNEVSGKLTTCSNGKHLENCQTVQCSNKQKCPNSYCIPYSYVCNGKWDCWDGADEHNCTNRLCIGLYICRVTNICIPLELICDSTIDCPFHDDEIFCNSCIEECLCFGLAISCKLAIIHNKFNTIFNAYTFIAISESQLLTPVNFTLVTKLILSKININKLWVVFPPGKFLHLQIFKAVLNRNLQHIDKFPSNIELTNMLTLNLSCNTIETISDFTFSTLVKLRYLDLSKNQITKLTAKTLYGLVSLNIFKIMGNTLSKIELLSLGTSKLELIVTDNIHVCCVNTNPKTTCTSKFYYNFPCKRLVPEIIFQAFGLVYGIVIISNNVVSFISEHQETKSIKKTSTLYNLLVITLHVSDISFGLYLKFLVILDYIKDQAFIEDSIVWKQSIMCKILSVVTFSIILISSLLVSFIALFRYLVICHPFYKNFSKNKLMSVITGCIMLVFSLSFLVSTLHNFEGNFTSFTPLCFFLGIQGASSVLKITNITISTLFMFIVLFSYIMYYLVLKISGNSSLDMIKSPVAENLLSRKKDLMTSISLTCLSIGLYYLSLSALCLSSVFLMLPPEYLQYYVVFVVIPLNPMMNPVIYHITALKAFILKKMFSK